MMQKIDFQQSNSMDNSFVKVCSPIGSSNITPIISPIQNGENIYFTYKSSHKYKNYSHIGNGSYCDVYIIIERDTNVKFCKKQVRKNLKFLNKISGYFLREINIMSKCDYFGIVKFKESFIAENIIIMEYIKGITLQKKISNHIEEKKPIPEDEILFIFYQLCLCMHYLENKNIMHRDIKPDNIMIANNNIVKMIDFGSAIEEILSDEFCGTPYHISPEIYKGEIYDKSIDVWSLGITLFKMIELDYPFLGKNYDEFKYNIIHKKHTFTKQDFYSNDLLSMIDSMLDKNPKTRCTIKQILQKNIMKNASIQFVEKIKICDLNDDEKNEILDYIDIVNSEIFFYR